MIKISGMKLVLDLQLKDLAQLLEFLRTGKFDSVDFEFVEGIENLPLEKDQIHWLQKKIEDFRKKRKEEYLKKINEYFKTSTLPVEKVWLFGSFARNEHTEASDVDLLIRFSSKNQIDLWDYSGLVQDLEELLDTKVDVVIEGGLKSFAVENADREKVLIYEKEAA